MFSLIITIISIALVAALAVATLYYGGSSFERGGAFANAAQIALQGQVLLGAAQLYRADMGAWPDSMNTLLSKGYLKSVPTVQVSAAPMELTSLAHAGVAQWSMPVAGQPVFEVNAPVALEVCKQLNLKTRGDKGVLKKAHLQLSSQCFAESDESLKVIVSAAPEALAAVVPAEKRTVQPLSALLAEKDSPEWAHPPEDTAMAAPNVPDEPVNLKALIGGRAEENQPLTLTAPAGYVFTGVHFASYGTATGTSPSFTQGGCHAATSAEKILPLVLNQSTVTLTGSNATFGDPCSGTAKSLAVVLEASASFASAKDIPPVYVGAVAEEGQTLNLVAPQGFVFDSVQFASYGTPLGASPNFTRGACHSDGTLAGIGESFKGTSSASVAVSSSILGEPCAGTSKRLALVLRAVYPGSTPPPAPDVATLRSPPVAGRSTGCATGGTPTGTGALLPGKWVQVYGEPLECADLYSDAPATWPGLYAGNVMILDGYDSGRFGQDIYRCYVRLTGGQTYLGTMMARQSCTAD